METHWRRVELIEKPALVGVMDVSITAVPRTLGA
jgi:hypothetical protein